LIKKEKASLLLLSNCQIGKKCTFSSNSTYKNIPLFDNNPTRTIQIITFCCPERSQ